MNDNELFERYLEPSPHHWGADEVRVKGSGVRVWALVGYGSVLDFDVERVADDYGLPREAVQAAFAWYLLHKAEIDERLAQNVAEPHLARLGG